MPSRIPPKYVAQFRNFIQDFPSFRIRRTGHATERMRERAVTFQDIRLVLLRGRLSRVEVDIRTGRDQFRIAGRTVDDRRLEVVVNLDAQETGLVTVVTVITPQNPGRGSGPGQETHGGGKPPENRNKP